MTLATWLESTAKDVRYALRTLRRDLTFAVVAVLALAVGIAANTTVFTIVNAVFFKNLPFEGSDRIVYLSSPHVRDMSNADAGVSFPDYLDFKAQGTSFAGLVATRLASVNLSDQTAFAERYLATQMTINGLSVIGRQPAIGRDFTDGDQRPDSQLVVILTDKMWNRRYGRSPAVLGTTIRIDGARAVVIGVTPPDVKLGSDNDLFLPIRPNFDTSSGPAAAFWTRRDRRQLQVFGRLADGASFASANTEVQTIARQLAAAHVATNKDVSARVSTYSEATFNSRIKTVILALQGAVFFVLLIACSNVANLLLARGVKRMRELSIRAAVGASRGRLIRQLLIESVLLSTIGGVLGWGLAIIGVRAFVAAVPPEQMPSTLDISIDGTVFAYLGAVSVGTGLLFGLIPAIRASRVDVQAVLKDGSHGAGGVRVSSRFVSAALVVNALALATILLAGAGLMIRSLVYVQQLQLGLNPSNVLSMRVHLAGTRWGRAEAQTAFHDRLNATLQSLPGVDAASYSTTLPANGWMRSGAPQFQYEVEGTPTTDVERLPRTAGSAIGPGFFRVLQAPLLAGREFTAADEPAADKVLVVNRSFAARAWPNGDAVGRRVRFRGDGAPEGWLRVVGVVADVLDNDFSQGRPFVYVPYAQMPQRAVSIVARTRVDPHTLAEPFRRAVQQIDPDLPVHELRTLDEHVALRRFDLHLFTRVFLAFGVIALILACTGLYAVIAHLVSQRSGEIGLRLAVGARPGDILRLVFGSGVRQIAIGLVLGLAGAYALTRALRAMLAGVSSGDPVTLVAVSALLAAAGLLGCAIPARRALRVDPVSTLRAQ